MRLTVANLEAANSRIMDVDVAAESKIANQHPVSGLSRHACASESDTSNCINVTLRRA